MSDDPDCRGRQGLVLLSACSGGDGHGLGCFFGIEVALALH